MKFKNVKVYGLEDSIIRSGYPMQIGEPIINTDEIVDIKSLYIDELMNTSDSHIKRSIKLAKSPVGSGHNNFLKGIIVQFDMSYPQYFTPQLQRYHWIDIVSSQSKMHSLTKITDVKENCNKYVYQGIINIINELIRRYNNCTKEMYPMKVIFPVGNDKTEMHIESKEECFQYIISNLPSGFELWMGISSNYLQLKNIYFQRKNHKLSEWREFCEWIKTLPMSELITGNYD